MWVDMTVKGVNVVRNGLFSTYEISGIFCIRDRIELSFTGSSSVRFVFIF